MRIRIGIAAMIMLAAGPAAAQQGGWHFGSWADGPAAAFTRYPNDPCQREELKSAGMLSYLNAKAGQAYGPTVRVVAVQALQGATGQSASNLTCRGILQLENGQQEAGTLSLQDPGDGSPVSVNWESDAAKDRRMDTPERQALRKFCETATSQGCMLYTKKISACRPLAGDAYSILSIQRLWRSKGSSPAEAAEFSIDAIAKGNPSGSPRDLAVLVKRAQNLPGTVPLQEFSDSVLKDCIASVSR